MSERSGYPKLLDAWQREADLSIYSLECLNRRIKNQTWIPSAQVGKLEIISDEHILKEATSSYEARSTVRDTLDVIQQNIGAGNEAGTTSGNAYAEFVKEKSTLFRRFGSMALNMLPGETFVKAVSRAWKSLPFPERARRARVNRVARQAPPVPALPNNVWSEWFSSFRNKFDLLGWGISDQNYPLAPEHLDRLLPDDPAQPPATFLQRRRIQERRAKQNQIVVDDGALADVQVDYHWPCHQLGACVCKKPGRLQHIEHLGRFCKELTAAVRRERKIANSSEIYIALRGYRLGRLVHEVYIVVNLAMWDILWGTTKAFGQRQVYTRCKRVGDECLNEELGSYSNKEPPWDLQFRRMKIPYLTICSTWKSPRSSCPRIATHGFV